MNRFPDTMGYPEIQGGTEEQGDMDWELFRQSSEQWFRKHLPNVGDEEIVMLIERVEIARLVGQYEILKQEQSTSLEILSALEVEIRKRRERIKDL